MNEEIIGPNGACNRSGSMTSQDDTINMNPRLIPKMSLKSLLLDTMRTRSSTKDEIVTFGTDGLASMLVATKPRVESHPIVFSGAGLGSGWQQQQQQSGPRVATSQPHVPRRENLGEMLDEAIRTCNQFHDNNETQFTTASSLYSSAVLRRDPPDFSRQ